MIPGALANARTRLPTARSTLARARIQEASDALLECRLCAHDCAVNRFQSTSGRCHAGAEARVFSAQIEVSDEIDLIPTYAIAFSGCDLRCDFCITGRESWHARAGSLAEPSRIAMDAKAALARGARTIMFLGGEPTVHLPTALAIVAELPDAVTLVWKTNAHGTATARQLLSGLFDIWVADYKFGNDACAQRLAVVPDYQNVVRENLLWAAQNSRLIVRHLLMPGHVECCWAPVAAWLADALPGVQVNLRSGFWPAWQSNRHPEFSRGITTDESRLAATIVDQCNLQLIP